ncbi:hypothetical protein BCV70DRAFT_209365 [Testicularia cyperi]|uniref:Uncharacterized protein n=1 Tax=Testicularia cyperi TaxID=1882483 RepID=A0A317XZZ2_9BASI|nr:hypothetical protein BCV70DRAFT_209365 [Testicularia cyperi]
MSNEGYRVSLCTSAAQLRGACKVRITVFVEEQGFDIKDEIDQYDPLAAHFALTHESDPSRVLGTLRLLPYPLPIPKPDEPGSEPDGSTSYPLGGSRTESAIAADFVSAAWSTHHRPVEAPLDPAQTRAEEEQTAKHMSEDRGGKLGRLALLKEVRGKKLGHFLVTEAEAWLLRALGDGKTQEQGAFGPPTTADGPSAPSDEVETLNSIVIKLSSQIYVIDFYKRLGYEAVGEQFMEDGAPHQLCCKRIFLQRPPK